MKILLSLFLIFLRIWVGYHITSWLVAEASKPELHSMSEIEFYLVIMVFDGWIGKSQDNIELTVVKKEEQEN
jgi:hypothetical protein